VSKLVELGAVILARTRRGRARKAGGRTLKGFEVSYLLPNYDEYFVRKLSEILMEEVSSVSEEILKRCRE
jgi:hypothetical protein